MLDFLAPKGLRAEVTEGIDLEQGATLTGQRITIGSGPNDTLRLGAADVVPGHLTFERRADGKGWDYFTSDRGATQVDRGNPRTGLVRSGMWLRLGRETKIELQRAALPAAPKGEASDEASKTVPMPLALGAMVGMAAIAAFIVVGLGDSSSGGVKFRTTPWVTGAADLGPALEDCLKETSLPGRAVASNDPASPFFRVMEYRQTDPARASQAQKELQESIRELLAKSHFLSRENMLLEASDTLRRLEYVLPVGVAKCPILSASRFDLALLEVRGSR